MTVLTPELALERLVEGNRRFQADPRAEHWSFGGPDLDALAAGQRPFAAVLGCADSRVPVEVVFGQGPGRLFVVRVAGNIAASSQIASLEFATAVLEVPLVVVLGHTGCGAVSAALANQDADLPEHLASLVARVAGQLPAGPLDPESPEDLGHAVEANVRATVRGLPASSSVLRERLASGTLRLVGAVYDLASGRVDWLDGAQ